MLRSFEIKNFRTFSHLRIERLGRVNLIVGKNNVGKTTLLEALHVYTAENPRVLHENLADHDELLLSGTPGEAYLDYGSLFHGRQSTGVKIILRGVHGTGVESQLRMELVEIRRVEDSEGNVDYHQIRVTEDHQDRACDVEPEGEIVFGLGVHRQGGPARIYKPHRPRWKYQIEPDVAYIRTEEVPSGMLARWWDSIAGTTFESKAIESLYVVAPLELIRLVKDPTRDPGRVFLARMRDEAEPIPLKSLGGGPWRMLQIAAAVAYLGRMSSAHQQPVEERSSDTPEEALGRRARTLLIDEIENGIHYTLQVKLWKLIFRLAEEYDLQVFATSHSWDCMQGFAEALAEDERNDGVVIRLEKVEGEEQTGAVIVNRDALPVVIRDSIEVR